MVSRTGRRVRRRLQDGITGRQRRGPGAARSLTSAITGGSSISLRHRLWHGGLTGRWWRPRTPSPGETCMDELAHAAGADPMRFRLDRLIDARLATVLRSAATRFGWDAEASGAGRARGWGCALGVEKERRVATFTEVRLDPGDAITGDKGCHSIRVRSDRQPGRGDRAGGRRDDPGARGRAVRARPARPRPTGQRTASGLPGAAGSVTCRLSTSCYSTGRRSRLQEQARRC